MEGNADGLVFQGVDPARKGNQPRCPRARHRGHPSVQIISRETVATRQLKMMEWKSPVWWKRTSPRGMGIRLHPECLAESGGLPGPRIRTWATQCQLELTEQPWHPGHPPPFPIISNPSEGLPWDVFVATFLLLTRLK